MNNLNPDDFEEILNIVRASVSSFVRCDATRSIESNFNTKSMIFEGNSPAGDGTIVIGEDDGQIAVDVNLADGEVISFILRDKNDLEGIKRITEWFDDNYI